MRFEDMNTRVNSSGYLKSQRQIEKPSLSNLTVSESYERLRVCETSGTTHLL